MYNHFVGTKTAKICCKIPIQIKTEHILSPDIQEGDNRSFLEMTLDQIKKKIKKHGRKNNT